jgi:hypothetical protein
MFLSGLEKSSEQRLRSAQKKEARAPSLARAFALEVQTT